MSVLKKNIIANFGGSAWTAVMGLLFVPLYIRFIGMEAYGLVGFFATILALLGFLDMGMGSTLNRELARLAMRQDNAQEMRDLVRTLEIPYWGAGVFLSILIISLSPLIATRWVHAQNLPSGTVQSAIMLMGTALAFQWPIAFYSGGLMGLQRQVLLNGINVAMATFRGLGALLVLWRISPTVEAFFSWQIVVSAIHIGVMACVLWRILPAAGPPRFSGSQLRSIWRFAAGMTGIAITSLLLTQVDKVILSKILTLEDFGYYTFSALVAAALQMFVGPFYSAVFPRFSELVGSRNDSDLAQLYLKSCQTLAVVLLPPAMTLVFFTPEILLLWTGDPVTVDRSYLIVRLLVIGAALNGVLNIPYALTLAYGWTKITIYIHVAALFVLVPMIYYFTMKYGVVGAPIGWIVFNCCNVLITLNIIHSRVLSEMKLKWYRDAFLLPLLASLMVAAVCRFSIPGGEGRVYLILLTGGALLASLSTTAVATPCTRSWIVQKLRKSHPA